MTSNIRDPVGTGVAAVIGLALGVTLAAPMLPLPLESEMSLGGDHVTALLVLGTVGLVAVPLGVFLLYIVFSRSGQ